MQVKDNGIFNQNTDYSEHKNSITNIDIPSLQFYSSALKPVILNGDTTHKILLAIQNIELCQQVKVMLTSYSVKELNTCSNLNVILKYFHDIHPALLILESPWNENIDTLETALKIRENDKRFPIILVTNNGSEALAINALRAGIKDYFSPPFTQHEFSVTVNKCIANYRFQTSYSKIRSIEQSICDDQNFIGKSLLMKRVKTYLQKIALVNSNVLITGETGTGKELTAQYIHQHSSRSSKPFIAINCAAIPESLLESELFGYEKGAFTGANSAYAGKLKLADGGTVFFDEIGDMCPYAQAKILRVIESKELYPLGAKRSVRIDIRVIAATNCDLENMVSKKEFRQDLYFRLNVARVQLPPLRDRKEDLQCLVEYYLKIFNELFGRKISEFSEEVWGLLHNYDWPGNIRELKNILESLYIDSSTDLIVKNNLPDLIRSSYQQQENDSDTERDLLLSTLCSVHWNKSKAAEKLHWSRMTLYRKIAKYDIVNEENAT